MRRDYIIGIYNACDYWCDRCAFTRRCRNFAMGEELEEKCVSARSDEENQAKWDSADAAFGQARKRLDELAAERFDDMLSDVDDVPDEGEFERFQTEQDAHDREVVRHFVVKAAEAYRQVVAAWLKSVGSEVKEATDRLIAQEKFSPETGNAREEIERLEELFDVVSWYHTLLVPKTHRMISGLLKLPEQTAWNDGSDIFGTGKLLLVSIDRSLSAWSQLLPAFPTQEDAILGFLVRLDHLRRGIERAAPQARAFVRPGLDEPFAQFHTSRSVE